MIGVGETDMCAGGAGGVGWRASVCRGNVLKANIISVAFLTSREGGGLVDNNGQ